MNGTYKAGETAIPASGDPAVDGLRIMAADAEQAARTLETRCDKLRQQLADAETEIATNKAAAERMRSAADILLG